MMRSWVFGGALDCDIQVNRPVVSGRHCRLTLRPEGYFLEDLGSTNGTFVNGTRITEPVPVSRADVITLGQTLPLPWPHDAATAPPAAVVVLIGRDPDNDVVVDAPTVSGRHARVVWHGREGEAKIEDLGSANGTAVGAPDKKASAATFRREDTIYLGSHPLPASVVFAKLDPGAGVLFVGDVPLVVGRDAGCDRVISDPVVSSRHAKLIPRGDGSVLVEDLGSSNGTFVNGERVIRGATARPGDALGLGSRRFRIEREGAGAAKVAPVARGNRFDRRRIGRAGAVVLAGVFVALVVALSGSKPQVLSSRLGLVAVSVGLCVAVAGRPTGDDGPSHWAGRAGSLAVVVALAGALIWGAVAAVASAPGGFWGSLLCLLAGLAGFAIGLVFEGLFPSVKAGWAVAVLVPLFWLLGAEPAILPRFPDWARALAGLNPSRWAFEGLLLLESGRTGARAGGPSDLAEPFFPAASARMGLPAVVTALLATVVGWAAAAASIATGSFRRAPQGP